MHPILFSIGSFQVYFLNVCIVLAWLVFSFLFWKQLRGNGVDEDKIFDLTFYSTLAAFIASRAVFVFLHWELFADTWLKIVALWVQPGFSLYGAFIGALLTLVSMSRASKVRLGHVLDAVALSFPVAIIVGLVGVFLDGSVAGKITDLPWALRVVGHVGKRHPVQIYEIIALFVLVAILWKFQVRSFKEKWPYGLVGVWFFILYSVVMFGLEFFKDSRVYWISLSANQWVLIALFAEALGAFYVRGGGRESLRPMGHKIKSFFTRGLGGIYAKFSKRRSE
jgi:phosphatidylglycerol---prolipoprotein diacylglyceryl transferase